MSCITRYSVTLSGEGFCTPFLHEVEEEGLEVVRVQVPELVEV